MPPRHDTDGRFARTLEVWDGSDWDNGWVGSMGRFWVYRPDFPRAYTRGHALRAHIVYWLAHGEPHPTGTNLHHINGDRLDDRLENLVAMDHARHSKHHNPRQVRPTAICEHCKAPFQLKKPSRVTRFCSQKCYHGHERSPEHGAAIGAGLAQAYAEGRR